MTEHYVTLFDSTFLPQGLTLHSSLQEHGDDYVMWVLCLDVECLDTLHRLNLPQVRLLDLRELETVDLLAVKPGRTRAEYCWTLTPWSIQWVFEADPNALRVTYLDADVFFLKSPAQVFLEFEASGKGVLITEHGYAPENDQTITSGRYCVQFLTVVRDLGEKVLYWWRDRCLEWCFARFEGGKFGDQKYLESFPGKFPFDVYLIGPDSRFQGPWNATIFCFSDAVIYHFHGLRLLPDLTAFACAYQVTLRHLSCVYMPYLRCMYSLIDRYSLLAKPQGSCLGFRATAKLKLKKKLLSSIAGFSRPPYYARYRDGDVVIW